MGKTENSNTSEKFTIQFSTITTMRQPPGLNDQANAEVPKTAVP